MSALEIWYKAYAYNKDGSYYHGSQPKSWDFGQADHVVKKLAQGHKWFVVRKTNRVYGSYRTKTECVKVLQGALVKHYFKHPGSMRTDILDTISSMQQWLDGDNDVEDNLNATSDSGDAL